MKTQNRLFSFFTALLLALTTTALAQSPPNNDDFAHRTPLTGSSITFTGTLIGATVEPAETNFVCGWPLGRSVWWTWTAPQSTAVIVAIRPESWPYLTNGELEVYTGTNLSALSSANTSAGFSKPPSGYVRFDATAGTSYQIRVAAFTNWGGVGGPFALQLTATNPPLFIVQPQNDTVSPYGSAFFSSIATGPQPRTTPLWIRPPRTTTTYQWYFNGVPLQDETYPCLLLHRVTTNQAGTYSVIASNIGGMNQSDAVTLTVIDTNPVPRLVVLPPNNSNLRFNLTGEPGRWYRIESSTNLQDWINPTWLQLTNPTTLISVPRLAPNHFVRAALDVHTDACVGQLKQMFWAVHMYQMDNQKASSDYYGLNDLQPYVPATSVFGTMPFCPDLGTYAAGGALRDPPTCTMYLTYGRGHVISNTP
jgi:hypothetical protein